MKAEYVDFKEVDGVIVTVRIEVPVSLDPNKAVAMLNHAFAE